MEILSIYRPVFSSLSTWMASGCGAVDTDIGVTVFSRRIDFKQWATGYTEGAVLSHKKGTAHPAWGGLTGQRCLTSSRELHRAHGCLFTVDTRLPSMRLEWEVEIRSTYPNHGSFPVHCPVIHVGGICWSMFSWKVFEAHISTRDFGFCNEGHAADPCSISCCPLSIDGHY